MQHTTLTALLAACMLFGSGRAQGHGDGDGDANRGHGDGDGDAGQEGEFVVRKRFVYEKRVLLNYLEPQEIYNRETLVVLLHGFAESAHMWETHMEMLRDAGYWPVALFLRGYGFTKCMKREWRKQASDFAPQEVSKDVTRLVRALGKPHAVLVAHEVGAMLAVSVALRNPYIVQGLMVLSLPVGPLPFLTESEVEGHIARLNAGNLEHAVQYYAGPLALKEFSRNATGWVAALYNGVGPEVRPVGTDFFTEQVQNSQPRPAFFTDAEFQREVEGLSRTGLHEVSNYYFQNYGKFFGMLEAFGKKKLEMPYAFVGGAKDTLLLQFSFALETMKELPAFRFEATIPDSGRFVVQENRGKVGFHILEFLRSL